MPQEVATESQRQEEREARGGTSLRAGGVQGHQGHLFQKQSWLMESEADEACAQVMHPAHFHIYRSNLALAQTDFCNTESGFSISHLFFLFALN